MSQLRHRTMPKAGLMGVLQACLTTACFRTPASQETTAEPIQIEMPPGGAIAERLEIIDSCAVSGSDIKLMLTASAVAFSDTCDGNLLFLSGWSGDLEITALRPLDLVMPNEFAPTSLRVHGSVTGVLGDRVAPRDLAVYAPSFDAKTVSPSRLEAMASLFDQYAELCEDGACPLLRVIQIYDSIDAPQFTETNPGHLLERGTFVFSHSIPMEALLAWRGKVLTVTLPSLESARGGDEIPSVVERLHIKCSPECTTVLPLIGSLPPSLDELVLQHASDHGSMIWDLTDLEVVSFDGVQLPRCELRLAAGTTLHLADSTVESVTFVGSS